MPNKCESCRHFRLSRPKGDFRNGTCSSEQVALTRTLMLTGAFLPISTAREICDREGDGIFVYFEPKEPTAPHGLDLPTDWEAHRTTPPETPMVRFTAERALKAAAEGII